MAGSRLLNYFRRSDRLFFSVAQKPRLIHKPDSSLATLLLQHCSVLSEAYRPATCCSGAKIQTVMANLMKRTLPIAYRRELLETPDGGEISLDWLDNSSETSENPATRPTVLIVPGLTSTSRQNYVQHLVQQIAQNGYRVVVFNNRGLGGVQLKTRRFFCGANTEDLEFVISSIRKAHPEIPLLAVGACFGGMVLTNYLVDFGSQGKDTGLVGALTISAFWNYVKTIESLNETLFSILFNYYLTKCLHKLVRRNRAILEDQPQLPELSSVDRVLRTSSLYEFDSCITAPMFGFESADAYYQAASVDMKSLDTVNVPLLCLCATDDPFIPEDSIPFDMIQASPNIVLALTARGGHLWFSERFLPTGAGYADRLTGQYVKAIFEQGAQI